MGGPRPHYLPMLENLGLIHVSSRRVNECYYVPIYPLFPAHGRDHPMILTFCLLPVVYFHTHTHSYTRKKERKEKEQTWPLGGAVVAKHCRTLAFFTKCTTMPVDGPGR